jgi:hypothetical protein
MRPVFAFLLLAAAPSWASCGDAEVDWDAVPALEDAAAQAALAGWKQGLAAPARLDFPTTTHWKIDVLLKDFPRPLGKAADATASIMLDTTLLGGNRYRSRITLEIISPDFDEYINIWLDSDGEELRIKQRGLDGLGPFRLPTGLRLSADRQGRLVGMLQRLASSVPGMEPGESAAIVAMDGICEFFHPDNAARFLGTVLQQGLTRWRQADGQVQATFVPLAPLVGAAIGDGVRDDSLLVALEELAKMEAVLEFDRDSGALLRITSGFAVDLPDLPTSRGGRGSMEVQLTMERRSSEVAGVSFTDRDDVLDLDDAFDEYWPAIAALEPAILTAYADFLAGIEAGGDISF